MSETKSFALRAAEVFAEAIRVYTEVGSIDTPCPNPYPPRTIEHDLFAKNWIDHRQWALEDIIRDPEIEPSYALDIKRRIDRSNQERTDLVELIDSYFLMLYRDVTILPDAKINTESPAWAIDRLSILCLKIHYMQTAEREATRAEVKAKCGEKLAVLREQWHDLTIALSELFEDIASGRKYMKVYKQMKMYNDPELNPMLKGQTL